MAESKLEKVKKVLNDSAEIRAWVRSEYGLTAENFDDKSVSNYEEEGLGPVADTIIEDGMEAGLLSSGEE